MIVLTCRAVPRPGQQQESQAAAREVTTASQGHEGLIGYWWNFDEATSDLHVIEVHRDEASVLNHIALADLSRLGAACSFEDIKIFGGPLSPELLKVLSGFGAYQVYQAL